MFTQTIHMVKQSLNLKNNLASFLRCRRKFKGILQNGGFYLEVSSKTMDTFLVPFPFHSEIVHTVVNLLCACYLASLFSIALFVVQLH